MSSTNSGLTLVLASTSRYRRELLERLKLPFQTVAPGVDETPLSMETPDATAGRLALAKAKAAQARFPRALIIGSDQVATCEGMRLDKPGNHAGALSQLASLSILLSLSWRRSTASCPTHSLSLPMPDII